MADTPATLADLFHDEDGKPLTLGEDSQGKLDAAIGNVPGLGKATIRRAVEAELDSLLDVEIVDVLCGGWRKLEALQAFRDTDGGAPEEIGFVPLAGHTILSTHHPTIEILLDEKPLATITLDVTVELKVEAVTLKIQSGRIVEILGGEYWATASLGVEGNTLVRKATKHYPLPVRLPLGAGIPIPEL